MHVFDRRKLSDQTSVARRMQPRNFYDGHDAKTRDRTEREDQTVLLTTITRSRGTAQASRDKAPRAM